MIKYVIIGAAIMVTCFVGAASGLKNIFDLSLDFDDLKEMLNGKATEFWWPINKEYCDTSYVSSKYGYRGYVGDGASTYHRGIDISGANCHGEGVIASYKGKVTEIETGSPSEGYGNFVKIEHKYKGKKIQTMYAHLSEVTVKKGQRVSTGQEIGKIGNTGTSYGAHLHFEIRIEEEKKDPLDKSKSPYVDKNNPYPTGAGGDGQTNISDGNLMLVNEWCRIEDKDWVPDDLVSVYGSSSEKLTEEAAQAYKELVIAAANDGVNLFIISGGGHRTYEYQLGLDPNGVKDLVADPDASEHRTGLAVDFNKAPEWGTFINSYNSQWKWLCNNAMNYGFILRYPLGCKDKTGISAESWHWRYIGKDHAKKFYEVAESKGLATTSKEQESKGIMEGAYTGDTTTYYLYTFEEYYDEYVK